MVVPPAKTQIILGIRPVWSESSLSAWRSIGSLATHWAHSEDWSDWAGAQADLSLCWAHRHFVGFVMSRLTSVNVVAAVSEMVANSEQKISRTWFYFGYCVSKGCLFRLFRFQNSCRCVVWRPKKSRICHYLSWTDSIKPSLLFSNLGCCNSKGSLFRLFWFMRSKECEDVVIFDRMW